jgi:dienelactone hydrolase
MLCDTKLVVERVRPEGVTAVYAFASATEKPLTMRLDAKFVRNELHATLPNGDMLAYRIRSEHVIEFLRLTNTQGTIGGVLSKEATATRLPVTIDGERVTMEFRVYKPAGDGPFPTVVFNHGSTGRGSDPSLFTRPVDFHTVGEFFVKRGYALVMPSRRGRGNSEGLYDEGFGPDRSQGYSYDPQFSMPGAERALRDIDAAIDAIVTMKFVDPSRLLIGGVSRGGILSVAYAGLRPDRVVGVVNFVGGWMDDQRPAGRLMNRDLFLRGARFPGRALWLYGDKDPFYSLAHSQGNFAAFVSAGGRGSFHEFQPIAGTDGHGIVWWPKLWGGTVEEWLKSVGLPFSPR